MKDFVCLFYRPQYFIALLTNGNSSDIIVHWESGFPTISGLSTVFIPQIIPHFL